MVNPYAPLEAELTQALSGLDSAQTQLTPPGSPHKWSIQQIVEHLLLSYCSTYGTIQQRLDKGTATKASPSVTQRLAQFTIIALGHFPAGRAAPPAVTPADSATALTGPELIAQIHSAFADLDLQSREAGRLFGRRRFASHLVLGPLSISQWKRFHLIHGRHHIVQIRVIRSAHHF